MRIRSFLFVFVVAVCAGYGQRHKLGEVNAEKPEGQLLQQIGQESDEAKKLALLEQFAAQYPKHEALGWVYVQMQAAYMKANQPDKALDIGDKLVAMDPEDVESAHQSLKAAEAKKDADLIRKWATQTSQIALQVAASPQPKDEDEVELWKKRVDYAKQVNTYAEYALYAAALQAPEPQKKISLLEALQALNPKSEYLKKAEGPLFLAYRQTGANDRAIALAERVLAADQSDEDMLLVVALNDLQKRRNPDQVLAYASKIEEIMGSKAKPEGVSDADWQNRKNTFLGLAHYVAGTQYFSQNKFAPADKELRASLPLIANPSMKAEVLFNLGMANYKMEKIQDAVNFNRECAAIKSPFQARAAQNLKAIMAQYRGVK